MQKTIHLMWLDKNPAISNIPKKYVPYIDTWKRMNKDWKIKIWYTQDIIELLKNNFSDRVKEFWYNLEPHICKCDFARFLLIYAHGGLYVDLDFICRKNITPLIGENTSLFFKELPEHLYYKVPQIYVGIFYAVKGLPFIRGFIDYVMTNYNKSPRVDGVLENTGPIALARYYQISPYSIVIGNQCDIGPYTDKQMISKACSTDDSYAYTLRQDGSTTINDTVHPLTTDSKKYLNISYVMLVLFVVLTMLMFVLYIVLRKKWILVLVCISLVLSSISIGFVIHYGKNVNAKNLSRSTKSIEIFPINLIGAHRHIPAKLINKKYAYYNPSIVKIKGQKYIWIRKSSFHCGQGSTIDGNVNQHLFGKLTDSNDLMLETLTHFILPKDIYLWKHSHYKHFPNELTKYFGVEDIRLTYGEEQDILILTGSYPFKSPTQRIMKTALYYAELDYTSAIISNEKILAPGFVNNLDKHVKNIVPVFKGKKLYIIHTLYPFVLCEIDHNTNTYSIVKEIKYKLPFKFDPKNQFVSGGSSLLPIGDFYLGIGHVTYFQPRSYKHFFYLLDKDCHIISYTREPFCIDKKFCKIQFAIGIVIEDNNVLISYGENDCHTKIHIYSLSSICSAMSSINQTPCNLKIGEDRPWCCILNMFMTLLGVHYALEDTNIIHWIDFGTLLGAVRGKEVIKYTNDIDLSIMATNKEDAIMALEKHMGNTHNINTVDTDTGSHQWIYVTDKQYPGISLNIALRIEHNNKLYDGHISDKKPINVSDTFPLSQTEIYGFVFPSPRHSRNVLTNYYGPNYMIPRRYQHSGDSEDDMSKKGSY
jgi:predicted GH43/DUF377 family glycosyl hydrolase